VASGWRIVSRKKGTDGGARLHRSAGHEDCNLDLRLGGAGPSAMARTAGAEKMLKMKVDPEMLLKTKDRMTKCLVKKQTFSAIEP
jgi:hypothetical protein